MSAALKNSHVDPLSRTVMVGSTLPQRACGKGIFGVHRTFKGEGAGGRKLGEYRESWSRR